MKPCAAEGVVLQRIVFRYDKIYGSRNAASFLKLDWLAFNLQCHHKNLAEDSYLPREYFMWTEIGRWDIINKRKGG